MPATVTAVTAVHEDVHQRAGEQQQEGQRPEEVGAVFAEEEVRGDSAEYEKSDGIPGAPERWRVVLVGLLSWLLQMRMVVIHQEPPKVQLGVLAALSRGHA